MHNKQVLFSFDEIISIEEISEQTYVNWIFKVILKIKNKQKVVYLRQSREFVKKKPDIKLDPKRIVLEVKIIKFLQTIIPNVTPHVLYFDKTNNIVILEDIKKNGHLLVHELTQGKVYPETGKYFGKIIATIHGKTLQIPHRKVHGTKTKNELAKNFHLGMRLSPAKNIYPEDTKKLLIESNIAIKCLVLGDLASKNIFVDGNKIRFLDLERVFIGDPAFDLAFLFCHYLIEVPRKSLPHALEFIKNFMQSYRKEINKYLLVADINRLESRTIKFLGITILYRLYGFYLAVNVKNENNYWENIADKLLLSNNKETNLTIKLRNTFI